MTELMNDGPPSRGSEEGEDNDDSYSLGTLSTLSLESGPRREGIGLLGQPASHIVGVVEQRGKSNLYMAFMNMANSIIGAGVIGQAYAIRQAGLVAGIFLLVALTIVIDWTIRLMVTNSKLSSTKTYQQTVQTCFGRPGLIIVSVAQGCFAFGGSMAFCVIIGDTVPHVLRAIFPNLSRIPVLGWLTLRRPIIVLFVLGISYPLALNRNIAALAKASALALVSMVVITLTVAIRGPALSPADARMTLPLWTVNSGFFQAVSVISFAFVCHHNSLLIYDSLKTPSTDRFATVTHWSTGVSMVACMVLGLGGFLSFKDKTLGNILNNFPAKDTMANIARFCFGFNMVTTLPLEIFVCREVLQEYMWPGQQVPTRIHAIITTILVVAAMCVSLFTCNLGVILELVGSSSASCMAYILPPMCYLRLSDRKTWSMPKISCYVCITFGILVMIISTVQSLVALIRGSETSHCG